MENLNQLSQNELSALATFINYSEANLELLSNFYDVSSLLLENLEENPKLYKAREVLDTTLSSGKIKKSFNVLEKQYLKDRVYIDAVRAEDALIPDEIAKYFACFSCEQTAACTYIKCQFNQLCDVYMNIPRNTKMSIKNLSVVSGTKFAVQNIFNLYGSEKFVLAFHSREPEQKALSLSVVASAQGATKGSGEIFIYAMTEKYIYRDYASKYFDVSALLKRFKG